MSALGAKGRIALAAVILLSSHNWSYAADISVVGNNMTKAEVGARISSMLDFDIYWPLAMAQWHAVRCEQLAWSKDAEAKLVLSASKIVKDPDLISAKLHGEQSRCCKMGGDWNVSSCDAEEAHSAMSLAENMQLKLDALIEAYWSK